MCLFCGGRRREEGGGRCNRVLGQSLCVRWRRVGFVKGFGGNTAR